MSDSDKLLAKIARLATTDDEYDQGRRVLVVGTGSEVLAAILQEIDETVLERELVFHSGSGQVVSLVAKGRRLLSVSAVEPGGLVPDGVNLLAQPLSSEDGVTLAALAGLIGGFAANASKLSVLVSDSVPAGAGAAVGVSVPVLRAAWLGEKSAGAGGELDRFLQNSGGDILACVLMADDTQIAVGGPDDMVRHLAHVAATQISGVDAELRQLNADGAEGRLITIGQSAGNTTAYVRIGGQFLVLAFEASKLPDVVAAWQMAMVSK